MKNLINKMTSKIKSLCTVETLKQVAVFTAFCLVFGFASVVVFLIALRVLFVFRNLVKTLLNK